MINLLNIDRFDLNNFCVFCDPEEISYMWLVCVAWRVKQLMLPAVSLWHVIWLMRAARLPFPRRRCRNGNSETHGKHSRFSDATFSVFSFEQRSVQQEAQRSQRNRATLCVVWKLSSVWTLIIVDCKIMVTVVSLSNAVNEVGHSSVSATTVDGLTVLKVSVVVVLRGKRPWRADNSASRDRVLERDERTDRTDAMTHRALARNASCDKKLMAKKSWK